MNYQLDRKAVSDAAWRTISVTAGTTFTDQFTSGGEKYNYRLKAMNAASESADYAYTNADIEIILGTEDHPAKSFEAFPNPVKRNENLEVRFSEAVTGTLAIFDKAGRKLEEAQIKSASKTSLGTKSLDQGDYFLRFEALGQQITKKIFVTH